jgi:hypothetical protein
MLKVEVEKDRVVLDLRGRRRDVLLDCDQALAMAEALEMMAAAAEVGEKTPLQGKEWGCLVVSYRGFVALRFAPPEVGFPDRVPLPASAALQLAAKIREQESFAKDNLRLEVKDG